MSDYVPVISGVPQGSLLGPVLFWLYINDTVDLFGGGLTVKMFADDVKIYAVIKNISDANLFQTGLESLNDWSQLWQLPISINKCAVLHLGRKNVCNNYALNNINYQMSQSSMI